ncbi:MAG TPA: hypothetical protein GX514_09085 [Thermoanaerobacterales bacterium]|nr:hypothetical protein [Thermoanaerobacterales bacterium]
MDWILELVKKNMKDGELDQEALVKDINKEFPKYAVPKAQYNSIAEAKRKLEEDVKIRDEQLEKLKEVDVDKLKEQIEALQEENRIAKENYEKELKEIQLNSAIKLAIAGKAHDEDIVASLIKRDELVLSEDGKVIGLDEQIEALKETKSFLFKQEEGKEEQLGFQKIGNDQKGNSNATEDAIAAAFGNLKKD